MITAELHDGRTLEFPDGTDPAVVQSTVKRMLAAQPAAETPKKAPAPVGGSADMLGSIVNTISEPLATMGTGTVASIAAALGGGGTALLGGDGAKVRDKIMESMTYQPRSAGGKAVMHAIDAPFKWLAGKAGDAGQAVMDKTGSPTLATATDTGINALPMLMGGILGRSGSGKETAEAAAARAGRKSRNSVEDETLARGRAEGLGVPPSAIDRGSFVGNRIESVGGKAAIGQEYQLKNQEVVRKIARREASLGENDPINPATLDAARSRLAAPYREFEKLPGLPAPRYETQLNPMRSPYPLIGDTPPTPKELVRDWKSINTKATELWKDYQRNNKVETLEEFKAQLAKKSKVEELMDKTAEAAGRSDLIPALKDARTKLAKNYDVERALNLGNGDVDPRLLGRMYDHGAPLTDGLETVARFANAFEPFMREQAKVPAPGVSKSEAIASAVLGLSGHAALGPFGGLAALAPLVAPPAARRLMTSRLVQGPRNYERGVSGLLAEQAAQKAGLLAPMTQAATLQSLLGPNQ